MNSAHEHEPSAGCNISMDIMGKETIKCPFEEFCGLLTRKLLRQLSHLEQHTIVEGASQNVSCFLWPDSSD